MIENKSIIFLKKLLFIIILTLYIILLIIKYINNVKIFYSYINKIFFPKTIFPLVRQLALKEK